MLKLPVSNETNDVNLADRRKQQFVQKTWTGKHKDVRLDITKKSIACIDKDKESHTDAFAG